MTDQEQPENPQPRRPVVRIKPSTYKPTKAEVEEPITFPEGTTVEDLARAAVMPVTVVTEDE